jgi:NitT/TauT family transport system permease protein
MQLDTTTTTTTTTPVPVTPQAQPDPASGGAGPAEATRRIRRRRLLVHSLRFGFLALVLGGWELGARTRFLDPFFFGQPSRTAHQIWTWAVSGTSQGSLWQQIWVTLEESFLGFFIGVVLGVVLGVTLGRVRFLAEVFGPYIKTANSIPRIVLGSIFIIWFGLGTSSKVALAVVLVFFAVFFNAFQGTREVNREIIANARILGASNRQITFQVVLPSAMTWIIASLHTSFGFALIGAVVGEFLGATKGLGLLIATAQGTFNPNGVFAAMFILAVVALLAEGAITFLEGRLLSWRPPQLASTDI